MDNGSECQTDVRDIKTRGKGASEPVSKQLHDITPEDAKSIFS